MSLALSFSLPKGVTINTSAIEPNTVFIGECEISIEDFCCAVEYVLENTDLIGDCDPRLHLVDRICGAKRVKGYNKGSKRITLR